MKNSSIGLALGLAAIDGLTCAFVAMLILALVLIGPGQTSAAPDVVESKSITIRITNSNQSLDRVDLRLLADINVEGSTAAPAAFTVESQGRLFLIKALQNHVGPKGGVWWKDCQAQAGGSCLAQLFVSAINQHERPWRIRLRVADSGDGFTSGDGIYDIEASLGDQPASNLKLMPGTPLIVCADWGSNTLQQCK
jgi:hypothetical protein